MDKKIVILVVTYNRLEKLKIWIEKIKKIETEYTYYLIIDNSSTDGTLEYCKHLENTDMKCRYVRLSENTGGAGGFYTGIKYAFDDGADLIWGMDDDAYPEKDALEKLLEYARIDNFRNCYWSNADNDNNITELICNVEHFMFVGFLITREVISKVGFPRKDFFIYLDDIEYSYRIKKEGYNIYKIKNSVIQHTAGKQVLYPSKFIFSYELKWANLPDWKFYYWVRNYILMYSWDDINKYITITLKMFKIFFMTLIFNRKQIRIFLCAYRDGICGNTRKI